LDFFLRQIKPPDVQEKYMIGEKETTEHGVTLVDAPLLLDEGFGLEEVSLTTLLELADAFKPLCLTLDANYANPLVSSRKLGHSSFQEMYLFLTFLKAILI
jgi:hypothetical protein